MANLDTPEGGGKLQASSTALAWAPYIVAVLALTAALLVAVVGGPDSAGRRVGRRRGHRWRCEHHRAHPPLDQDLRQTTKQRIRHGPRELAPSGRGVAGRRGHMTVPRACSAI